MQMWLFAESPFGFRPLLLPETQTRWQRHASNSRGDGRKAQIERIWQPGFAIEMPQLPWTFILARPAEESPASTLVHGVPEDANCHLQFRLSSDAPHPEPLAPNEDGVGLMSLLAEYVGLLGEVFARLELTPLSIGPMDSGLVLELPAWDAWTSASASASEDQVLSPANAAASKGGRDQLERILLAAAIADWLARGRGFRIGEVRYGWLPGEWHTLDGSWL